MRKLEAVALAIPVLVAVYLASLVRRHATGRVVAGFAAFAIVGLVVLASLPPARSTASPASGKPAPVSAELLDAVRTGHPLTSPFSLRFAAQMDAASVAAALRVAPDAAMTLRWDAAGTTLTIAPVEHWQPDTLYTVTVDRAARSIGGGALATPVHALILTEPAGSGEIAATKASGTRVRVDTAFDLALTRAVSVDAVEAALRSEPVIHGDVAAGDAPGRFVFTPSGPLAANTTFRVWLEDLVDADGIAFGSLPSLSVKTVPAPAVVRFRPRAGTGAAERFAAISVRFTERMDRARTAAAFHVTVGDRTVAGKVSWAEKDTVLVFDPTNGLPYGAKVTVRVDLGATSRLSVPVAKAASGTFTVEAKPKPRPKASTSRISTGGGGAVSGSWTGVESYYLRLMNCTRTGGWVTSGGDCSSPGGRDVAPLKLSSGISSKVSRPYAKLLATRALCSHFVGGDPGDRLRAAGYTSYRWAENLGCRSGDPYAAVLGSHLYFQSEKSYNGGHYVNLMNAAYDRAGIGVWVSGGRVRLVVDFYHP